MVAKWKIDDLGIGMPYRVFEDVIDGLKKTVNPLERNSEKEIIANKLEKSEFNKLSDFAIKFNSNYDDNAYKGGSAKSS